MTKITFIGAGSTVFAKNLLVDILSFPELSDATITLFDIDPHRLGLSQRVAQRVADAIGAKPTLEATTDREKALDGADYAINMIQVGGYDPATITDFEIPKKYGLRQTIGDTLGIGGIMRALRTVPVLVDMARDMERLAPDVTHINYVNPMAINIWALTRATSIATVGLCHSVPGTAAELAEDIGVPADEIDYLVGGINHLAFYLKFEHKGRDLYPEIGKVLESGRMPEHNQVRYEMFRRLGYFVTESSEHFAEYVPYFIKSHRPELIERFNIPLDEYVYRCQAGIKSWEFIERELENPGSQDAEELRSLLEDTPLMPTMVDGSVNAFKKLGDVTRSVEYGSNIIYAMETGDPQVIYGNVPNTGLIDNLPEDAVVEVPILVDRQGLQPTHVGAIPPHLTALMSSHINVQRLVVEAVLTGNRDHVYHAAMMDPHTASELPLDEIWALVDDLIEAHGDFIPDELREKVAAPA